MFLRSLIIAIFIGFFSAQALAELNLTEADKLDLALTEGRAKFRNDSRKFLYYALEMQITREKYEKNPEEFFRYVKGSGGFSDKMYKQPLKLEEVLANRHGRLVFEMDNVTDGMVVNTARAWATLIH